MRTIKLLALVCLFFTALQSYAQTPQAFNYQAIVRNASGNPLVDSNITVRVTIHTASASGTVAYQETQAVKTNQFGLINLQIGNGTVVSGTFSAIPWQSNAEWIQVEANFGSGYISMSTSQLLSVPYALSGGTPLPTGLIVMWSGLISNIPSGWLLCDGTKGTPNLTDKFIYGVSSAAENPGTTGGDSVHTLPIPVLNIVAGASSASQLGYATNQADVMCNYEGTQWWAANPSTSQYMSGITPTNYYGTAVSNTGSGNTMPPYYKLAFIMKQ